ncbi:MAG: divergent polysaccharide deacetylase family protein [Syntrophales bacterium]|nr:divergent polysaccharide deacetylase family protein [Syntrophales bacterium]
MSSRKRRERRWWFLSFLVFLVCVSLVVKKWYGWYERSIYRRERSPISPQSSQPSKKHLLERSSPEREVAIVIDDVGGDLFIVKELLAVDAPLTFAVLPDSSRAREVASIIHQAGREVILHLPMEPEDPGKRSKGMLLSSMVEDELRQLLDEALKAVPFVSGVNNHMGSSFMQNEDKVEIVLKELKKRGLFFVDSLTTPNSTGMTVARELDLPFASRTMFIDNLMETPELLVDGLSRKKGPHILFGHPYRCTVEGMDKLVALLRERGFVIVSVSNIVKWRSNEHREK